MLSQTYSSHDSLIARFPGVEFAGDLSLRIIIGHQVSIDAGAVVDAEGDIYISGTSHIGPDAVITEGHIQSSRILGTIHGGRIRDCLIEEHAIVGGGELRHSTISGRGRVTNGNLSHTTVRDDAAVFGGDLSYSVISGHGRVTGGILSFASVQDFALVIGGVCDHILLTGNRIVTSDSPFLSSNSPSENDTSVARVRPFPSIASRLQDTAAGRHVPGDLILESTPINKEVRSIIRDPPEVIIDNIITFQPIKVAVCTPNGDTYDQSVILEWISKDHNCPITRKVLREDQLYPNRAVQKLIDGWEAFDASCGLVWSNFSSYSDSQ
jgi:hypothetical protein